MPDIITTQIFADNEKGITAAKMNNIIANSTIQTDFVANKPAGSALNPTDQILELTSGGTYARITGAQLSASVAGQLALANTSQSGMLHQTSGNIGDYCGGDNLFHVLNTFTSLTAATTLTSADTNKLLICSGGSWTLTLPAAANGLAHRLRNDMGITGTTGTITVTPPTGTIDGAASLKLLPQQECTILCDGTNWRSFGLKREVILGTNDITTTTANAVILLPVGYRYFEMELDQISVDTDSSFIVFQLSADGGSTWASAASNYNEGIIYDSSATAVSYQFAGYTYGYMAGQQTTAALNSNSGRSTLRMFPGSASAPATWGSKNQGYSQGNARQRVWYNEGYFNAGVGVKNALKYFASSGNITRAFLTVKGVV